MRIRHNIPGMTTFRSKNNATRKSAKTLEKLSTGYRINRSADDAAGLSVSEKMRISITGLNRAIENSDEGIDLIQIAEGAMGEMHDMINRMFFLAEQSRNGTYSDEIDRVELDKEYQNLLKEIDRIADSTRYGDIKLLDGSNMRQGKDPAAEIAQRIATLLETQTSKPAIIENERLSSKSSSSRKAQVAGMNQNAVVVAYASGDSESEVKEIRKQASEDNAKMEAAKVADLPNVPAPVNNAINLSGYTPDANGVITVNEDGRIDISQFNGKTIQIADGKNVTLEGSKKDIKVVCGDNVTLHLDGVEMENTMEDGLDDNVIEIKGKGCVLNLFGNKENKLTSTAELVLSPDMSSVDDQGRLFKISQKNYGKAVIAVHSDAELTISGNPDAKLFTRNLSDSSVYYAKSGTKFHITGKVENGKEYIWNCITKQFEEGRGGGGAGDSYSVQSAVIGGEKDEVCGSITIAGGVITVQTGNQSCGAAIGSGSDADGGNITITGSAEVTATTKGLGAGIGGGRSGNGGSITIAGTARVTATGSWGAGIGGGQSGNGGGITITDGAEVTATGDLGAGIGGGNYRNGGSITIDGTAKVTATAKNDGAGIGGGAGARCGTIVIEGGTVIATTEFGGAGIGNGAGLSSGTSVGSITITGPNTTVSAYNNDTGAAIGDGAANPYSNRERQNCTPEITVSNGASVTVSSASDSSGAALGGGGGCFLSNQGNPSDGGTLNINGGTVTVNSGWIGGGADYHIIDDGIVDYADDGTITVTGSGKLNYTDPRGVDRNPHPETNRPTVGKPNTPEIPDPPPDNPDPPPVNPDPPPDNPDPPPVNPDPPHTNGLPHQDLTKSGGLIFQIGETNAEYNRLRVYIDDMHTSAMGLAKTNILTQDNAAKAMTACRIAKDYVSNARGDMGAYINRLEHNISALKSSHENAVDSESSIRDADVANETLNFTKYNILNQSAQAMLAQANQLPNGVLQLLQQ